MPDQSKATQLSTRVAPLGKRSADAKGSIPATLNEEARSVNVILATESPVSMFDWDYGRVDEVLLMSGVVLPAMGQTPLLDSHNRYSVNHQLGSLRDFDVQGTELHCVAYFSTVAESAFTKVREGHLTDLSVGYRVLEHVFVPEKTTATVAGRSFTGPVKVATRWEVKEGSFTPIGADELAKTRAASDGDNREENPMPQKTNDQTDQGRAANNGSASGTPQNAATSTPAPEVEQSRAAAPAANQAPPAAPAQSAGPSAESIRAEVADIMMLGRTHNCSDLAEEAIRKSTSVGQFRALLLDHLAGHTERHAPSHMPHIEAGSTDSEKYRAAVSDALCMRAGSQYVSKEVAPGAQEMRGYTMKELARDCLRRAGLPTHGDMDMVGRAFTSTSDFPAVLADVTHKSVHAGAQEAAETFDVWTGEASATDFRAHTGVAMDAFSNLDIVPEHGEYKYGDISDRGVVYSVATYGKLFGVTRQAVINDDLNAFTKIPAAMGRAAMRTTGNAVYDLLTKNPQMADGYALFSAQHKNLALTPSEINAKAFGLGVTAMGTQAGKKEEALNITPSYMLLPVARYSEAHILLHSTVIGTRAQPNQANPWQGKVQPVTEARLDLQGNGAWFLTGPKGWGINVVFLGGNKTPRVEQRQGWTIDGTEFKISLDFGCYVEDWRTLYKNPGA